MTYICLILCIFEMFFRASLADLNSTYSTDNSTYSTDNSTYSTDNSTYSTDNSTYSTDNSTYSTDNSTYSTDNSTYNTDSTYKISEQSTITTTTTEKADKLFGNPFWVGFTVIFFISLVTITLAISLTFGLYKFRKEARKRGHFKRKAQVYGAPEDRSEVDYEIFTTCQDPTETESNEESNTTYLGAT